MAKFVPGKSGNPNGRSKVALEVRAYAQIFTKEAVDILVDMMRNSSDPKVRKSAADSILDRAIGKPSQDIELSGKDGAPIIPVINFSISQSDK